MNHKTRSTIPTAARRHADLVACQAAMRTRQLGGDISQCAEAYARAYAQAMRGER